MISISTADALTCVPQLIVELPVADNSTAIASDKDIVSAAKRRWGWTKEVAIVRNEATGCSADIFEVWHDLIGQCSVSAM